MTNREGIFGWHYPAGAANDPDAPYNQPDEDVCPQCEEYLEDCRCCEDCGKTSTQCICPVEDTAASHRTNVRNEKTA